MTFQSFLQMTEDFRTALERMNVTTQGLLIAFAIASIFFLLSLREVVAWFMKTPQLRSEIRAQRKQLGEMQKSLEQLRDMLLAQTAAGNIEDFNKEEAPAPKTKEAQAVKDGKRFGFDH